MSFHTVTMMVNWLMSADVETNKVLDEMKNLNNLSKDLRVVNYVRSMYYKWISGSKIERLAILGWKEEESIQLFCSMVKNIDQLRKEYKEQVLLYGLPNLDDNHIEEYEKEVERITKSQN